MDREIPLFTLEGVRDADVSTHHLTTEDKLGLSMLRFKREPSEDVVVILHGLTTSSDMFIMPEHNNLVSYLLDNGYGDVWTLDYRMSNRHPYNLAPHSFNMDDIALYDYPPALDIIRRETDGARIHVISHCLGAASFSMSLFGKAVDGITSLVANSVSLTPRVPAFSRLKSRIFPPIVEKVIGLQYVDPKASEHEMLTHAKIVQKLVSLFHRECDVPACHMLTMMWGSGHPGLYRHENLDPVTHRRGGDLYGGTSLSYHKHVFRMLSSGNTAVKMRPEDPKYAALPDNYMEHVTEVDTPVLFMTGEKNQVFSDSNIVCHQRFRDLGRTQDELKIIPGYGHQDPFMGKNVDVDVFPTILEWLRRHSSAPAMGAARAERAAA